MLEPKVPTDCANCAVNLSIARSALERVTSVKRAKQELAASEARAAAAESERDAARNLGAMTAMKFTEQLEENVALAAENQRLREGLIAMRALWHGGFKHDRVHAPHVDQCQDAECQRLRALLAPDERPRPMSDHELTSRLAALEMSDG